MKYAIVNNKTKDFYADPIYESRELAQKKIDYLKAYEDTYCMKPMDWVIEELTPERLVQHEKEWDQFVSAID